MAKKTRGFYLPNSVRVTEGEKIIGQLVLKDWTSYDDPGGFIAEQVPCLGVNAAIIHEPYGGLIIMRGQVHSQHGDEATGRIHTITKMADGSYQRGFCWYGASLEQMPDQPNEVLMEEARRAGVRYFVGIPGMQVPSPAMAGLVRMFLDAGVDSVELSTLQRAVSTRL